MANPNKAKGTLFETSSVKFLRAELGDDTQVYKPRQEGTADVGDIHVGPDLIIQCKDHGSWSKQKLYDWLDAAAGQAIAAQRPWSVALLKRRKGPRSSGKIETAVVAMSLQTFSEIMYDLAEGREAIATLDE